MKKEICMIAHRGYSGKYHENTEQAFLKAAENKSGGAETDVRRTADGKYILCHNREAKYIDGTELVVEESTFDDLMAKPIYNKRTDDIVYLCTFRRYLEIMRDNNMVCFIELKTKLNREQIKEVYDMIKEVYDLKKCIVQSFDFDNLHYSREYVPDIPIMLTYGMGEAKDGYGRCFEENFSMDADFNLLTDEMIEDFHSRGLEVAVWTVNTPDDLARMKKYDIDYIESDVFGGI